MESVTVTASEYIEKESDVAVSGHEAVGMPSSGHIGLLTKNTTGFEYVLVINERLTKLTEVVQIRRIDSHVVSMAFGNHWVFNNGSLRPYC